MSPYMQIMALDKTTIITRIDIHPDLRANPNAFIRDNDLAVRTSKPTLGRSEYGGITWNLSLDVLTYKGIHVKLTKVDADQLALATIDFNPGVCLYGYNGRVIYFQEFLDALGILIHHLRPLLRNQDDWVDLIPGLRPGGRAYWSYLEIPFQFRDTNGALFAQMRHLLHPEIRTPTRHWHDSLEVGGKRAKLQLVIYSKAVEMVAHGKLALEKLPDRRDILRLEARLKEGKLIQYLGSERKVEVIDGKERLVRFYPQDLFQAARAVFGKLQGVYHSDEPSGSERAGQSLESLGRLIAQVAEDPRSTHTFPELLSHLRFYTEQASSNHDVSNSMRVIRKAGMAELELHSPFVFDELFTEAAFNTMAGIANPEIEKMIGHSEDHIFHHLLISAAYRPLGRWVNAYSEFPTYIK